MAVDIKVWGPSCWNFLYAVAFSYPEAPTEADRRAVADFFNSLNRVLPCTRCRDHFTRYLAQHPIEANNASRARVASWLLSLNNDVNARIGKPPQTMAEVWDRLVDNGPTKRRHCMSAAVVLVVLGVALAYVLYRRCAAQN